MFIKSEKYLSPLQRVMDGAHMVWYLHLAAGAAWAGAGKLAMNDAGDKNKSYCR
jgi:hypothetical protein